MPRSASGNTITGDLPPSSSDTFLRLPAAAWMISRPTSPDPVNAILSTSPCAASAAPAVSPKPGTILTTPSGKPASWISCAEPQRRERRLLRRLEHDGAAGRERRRELPGRHHQRRVPRNDLPDHADRLAQRIGVEIAGLRQADGLAGQLGGPAGRVADHLAAHGDVGMADIGDRLAVVERLELGQLVAVLLDQLGEPPHQLGAVAAAHAAPGPGLERRPGGRDRGIDVGGIALRHLRDDAAGSGIEGVEGLARLAHRPIGRR